MGKRGPQPIDMQSLLRWEREWTYALRILRDGIPRDRRLVGRIIAQASPVDRVAAGLPPFEPVTWETKDLEEAVARTDIWNDLVQAGSVREVRSVCQRWKANLREVTTDPERQTALSGYGGASPFSSRLGPHRRGVFAHIRG